MKSPVTYEASARIHIDCRNFRMHIDYMDFELLNELEAKHKRRQEQNRRAVKWWRATGTRTERPVYPRQATA